VWFPSNRGHRPKVGFVGAEREYGARGRKKTRLLFRWEKQGANGGGRGYSWGDLVGLGGSGLPFPPTAKTRPPPRRETRGPGNGLYRKRLPLGGGGRLLFRFKFFPQVSPANG